MSQPTILLISDDEKSAAFLRETFGKKYSLETMTGTASVRENMERNAWRLVFLDFDLKAENPLEVFQQIHQLNPGIKIIILSSVNNIEQAVQMTKAGAAEFLRKPLEITSLKEALERNLPVERRKLIIPNKLPWLQGKSQALLDFFAALERSLQHHQPIFLMSERGVNNNNIAEIMHASNFNHKRKLVSLDLSKFRKDFLENNLLTVLQDIMAAPSVSALQEDKMRCGTLYIEGLAAVDEFIRNILLQFLQKPNARMDRSIRVIFAINLNYALEADNVCRIKVPALRERLEDLPSILAQLIEKYACVYDKEVSVVSLDLLNLFFGYDFPGNYAELENLCESMLMAGELSLKTAPLSFNQLARVFTHKYQRRNLNLEMARQAFEKELYQIMLQKSGEDATSVARFLDVPKTTFMERLEELRRSMV